MALPPPRTPPRFVPTLTEVVQVPQATPLQGAQGTPVAPAHAAVAPPPQRPAVPAPAAAMQPPLPDGMEEYMVHRVMQRVDVVLDKRLREAIATVVQEQTRSVLPRLREEIESVVRHAVYEAVADELASGAQVLRKG
ncbi:MAG: hypothetical protein QM569_04915 [Acidovorax sp.]|uniref:hypothetical protein n=1 Tax=Acidovorax sp. TaxID=1872122 RepID=UPI0039E4690F